MTQKNLEHFYQIVAQDQELQKSLKEVSDYETFVERMIELGKAKGHSFTVEEVEAYNKKIEKENKEASIWQELSDKRELETVVGGYPASPAGGSGALPFKTISQYYRLTSENGYPVYKRIWVRSCA